MKVRDDVEKQWMKNHQWVKKQQQLPTSQKPPGGFLKPAPPPGVLLSHRVLKNYNKVFEEQEKVAYQSLKVPMREKASKITKAEMAKMSIKKLITEVLLILPLYLILFFIWWRFWHLIKAMTDVGNILNDDDFFGYIGDTPKEGIEQHRKRECLKSVISKGKAYY